MKLEFNSLKRAILKDKVWLIILLILTIVSVINYYVSISSSDFLKNINYFYILIGVPSLKDADMIYTLLNTYIIIYFIYFTINYFNYDLDYCSDNIVLRENEKHWFIRKTLSIILYVIFIKLLLFILISIMCKFEYKVSITYLLITLIYPLTYSILTITLNNLFKNNVIVIILSLVISLSLFFKLNIPVVLIFIDIILFIVNYITFKFKRIYKLKYN